MVDFKHQGLQFKETQTRDKIGQITSQIQMLIF